MNKAKYKIVVYCGGDYTWYWRLKSVRNGKIIADGGEGYSSKSNALRAAGRLKTIDFTKVEIIPE